MPANTRDAAVLASLHEHLAKQPGADLPLEAVLKELIADIEEPGEGSILTDLLGPHLPEPGSDRARYFAMELKNGAVAEALGGRSPELAAMLPALRAGRHDEMYMRDFGLAVLDTVYQRKTYFTDLLKRGLQMNIPSRGRALFVVELLAAHDTGNRPIQVLALGPSAGLDLLADRYRYAFDGEIYGSKTAATVIKNGWGEAGEHRKKLRRFLSQDLPPITRKGCDLFPLDATSEDGQALLLAPVAQLDEYFKECETALSDANAEQNLLSIVKGHAPNWLARELSDRPEGKTTIVWSSTMERYLSVHERAQLHDTVTAAKAHATESSPFYYVRLDCPDVANPNAQTLHVESAPKMRTFSLPVYAGANFSLADFYDAAMPTFVKR